MLKSSKNHLAFTRLLFSFEGLQVWWIVDYRETGEYGHSDVNQKSKAFNWRGRARRFRSVRYLFCIFFWEFSSLERWFQNLGKERNESEVIIFRVLGTIIISECINSDNNNHPRSRSPVSYLFTSRRNFSFILGWNGKLFDLSLHTWKLYYFSIFLRYSYQNHQHCDQQCR